uniref:Putative acetyltransferase n=1 Tax=Micromonospora olivasterospora TaxID=1880 RepID=Q2MFX5_MICOL|nr:putative acetyltransferase [Micromonospora olivasterospora]
MGQPDAQLAQRQQPPAVQLRRERGAGSSASRTTFLPCRSTPIRTTSEATGATASCCSTRPATARRSPAYTWNPTPPRCDRSPGYLRSGWPPRPAGTSPDCGSTRRTSRWWPPWVAGGLRMHRAATELRHDLADLPMPAPLPSGWSLATPGWDDDLHDALVAAYGPGHPDGAWRDDHTAQVRAMFDDGGPVPPLLPASARVVGPDGRSAGHVLSTGPAPDRPYGWVVNLGVAPRAQGRGLGRALLTHALYGTRTADLPALALQVADGNSARRLYDAAGFRPVSRMFSVRLRANRGR